MEKEENIVSCGKKNLTQREIEMQSEIVSLKRQIGGYKRSNEEYRLKIKDLRTLLSKKDMEITKLKSVSNGVVPTTKFAELEQSLESKKVLIDSLQEKIQSLMVENNELKSKILGNNDIIGEYERTIEDLRRPWWKRLF